MNRAPVPNARQQQEINAQESDKYLEQLRLAKKARLDQIQDEIETMAAAPGLWRARQLGGDAGPAPLAAPTNIGFTASTTTTTTTTGAGVDVSQMTLEQLVVEWDLRRERWRQKQGEMQLAKMEVAEVETRLKQQVQSPTLVQVRSGGSELIHVSEIERKKTLTVRLLRDLLSARLGEQEGDVLLQYLMTARPTQRVQMLQLRKARPSQRSASASASSSTLAGPRADPVVGDSM